MKSEESPLEEARDGLEAALDEANAEIARNVKFISEAEAAGLLEWQRVCLNDLVMQLVTAADELEIEHEYMKKAVEVKDLADLIIGVHRTKSIFRQVQRLRVKAVQVINSTLD